MRKSLLENRVSISSVSGVRSHSRSGIIPSPVSSKVREENGVSEASEVGESEDNEGSDKEGLFEDPESEEDPPESDGASGVGSDVEVSSGADSGADSGGVSGAGGATGSGAGAGTTSGVGSGADSGVGSGTDSTTGAGSAGASASCATMDTVEREMTEKKQTTRKCLPKKEKSVFGVFQRSSIIVSICVVVL